MNAIDSLIEKIKITGNPTVMGLDPRYEMIPEVVRIKYADNNLDGVCGAILEYNKELIDNVCDIIPAIKPQLAFYEMYGIQGMIAFKETCKYAKDKGMIVIADAKRGDIGSTAKGYSNAYLGQTSFGEKNIGVFDNIDFLTVNPYLGVDSIKPFVEDCIEYNKGIFVLVKTSNPSSGELQDLKLENGETVYEHVANLVEEWGKDLIGKYNYSSVAAVVGATYPEQLKEIRKKSPHTYFLIPGYGAQGGKIEDIALGFDCNGLGGIVNASRSLMCAYKSDKWKNKFSEEDYGKATRAEALDMRDKLNSKINS